jgi:hypothetical protein
MNNRHLELEIRPMGLLAEVLRKEVAEATDRLPIVVNRRMIAEKWPVLKRRMTDCGGFG